MAFAELFGDLAESALSAADALQPLDGIDLGFGLCGPADGGDHRGERRPGGGARAVPAAHLSFRIWSLLAQVAAGLPTVVTTAASDDLVAARAQYLLPT